jgi:hypothetical protein
VHFGAVLLISAILSAPWHSLGNAGIVLAIVGAAGTLYVLNIVRHARRQKDYKPVLEDWLWHFTFPALTHATLLVAALFLGSHPAAALFWIGAVTVFLLFIGIHNAWDAVLFMALRQRQEDQAGASQEVAPPS